MGFIIMVASLLVGIVLLVASRYLKNDNVVFAFRILGVLLVIFAVYLALPITS